MRVRSEFPRESYEAGPGRAADPTDNLVAVIQVDGDLGGLPSKTERLGAIPYD